MRPTFREDDSDVDAATASANGHIRVSDRVKRELDRRRREGESCNDVLERVLENAGLGDFDDGFGRWSDEAAERVRERRRSSEGKRERRMRDRVADDG